LPANRQFKGEVQWLQLVVHLRIILKLTNSINSHEAKH
jgi:hypothetical protein